MPNVVANVSIPAPVIQFNNKYYLTDGQYDPQTINVPCGINAELDYFTWWAIPVQDDGIVSILQMVPAIGDNESKPTIDSISVIRVRDKYKPHYTWWVIATLAQYYASCAACCGDSAVPIPNPTLPIITPCQSVCDSTDANGNFIATFGIPQLPVGQHFVANGQLNGVAFTPLTATTTAQLLTEMNAFWQPPAASPPEHITWTKSSDDLTIIGTGFFESDVICLVIQTST